jgi:hypothetical protein
MGDKLESNCLRALKIEALEFIRQGLYNINSFILWCPGFNFGRELSGKFDAHLLPAKKGQR